MFLSVCCCSKLSDKKQVTHSDILRPIEQQAQAPQEHINTTPILPPHIARQDTSSEGSSNAHHTYNHNLSNFRISPNIITRSNSTTIEINTEALVQDISQSLDPIKENFIHNLESNAFENLKKLMADVFTDYSRQIIHEITKQIQDVVALNETIQGLEQRNKQLVKKNEELEYNYSMLITGNDSLRTQSFPSRTM